MFEASVFLVPVDKICHYEWYRYAPGCRVCVQGTCRGTVTIYTAYYNPIAIWLQGRCYSCYSYYFMYLSAALLHIYIVCAIYGPDVYRRDAAKGKQLTGQKYIMK